MSLEVAYLTAEQLDRHDPDACAAGRIRAQWTRNDDGSPAALCAYSNRRIDPATGLCGYHAELRWLRTRPVFLHRNLIVHPAPAYPLLEASRNRP